MEPSYEINPERPDAHEENLQRLLILAYARLFLMPERDDGSKLAIVAAFERFEVRLIELPELQPGEPMLLTVELYDREAGRILERASCRDLQDAGSATEIFIAAARKLAGPNPSNH